MSRVIDKIYCGRDPLQAWLCVELEPGREYCVSGGAEY